MHTISRFLFTTLLTVTGAFAHASSDTTIVLVHGAFADGSSWSKVIPLLQAKRFKVVAVQNPLTSLADDVAFTRRAIEAQPGPVVLVGHSWGGMVITEGGALEKVKSLVYIAALAPDVGESAGALGKDSAPLAWQSEVKPGPDGIMYLPEPVVLKSLAQDVPAAAAKVLAATQGATPAKIFGEAATVAAWKSKPSFYLVASEDRMIQPKQEEAMAKKIGAQIVRVKASHMPMLSKPKDVADLILRAAK